METYSDEELVTLAHQNIEQAKRLLVERYAVMVENFCRPRFYERYREDLRGELWLAFWILVREYPVDERSFREMVINRLYFRRFNFCKKEKQKHKRECSYEEWDDARESLFQKDPLDGLLYEELVEELHLKGNEEKVVTAIAQGGFTRKEIAGHLGIRAQSISKILKRLQERLRRKNFQK